MSKRILVKKWEKLQARTDNDTHLLNNTHMVGLGTFDLNNFNSEDMAREYRTIKRLKKMAGLI